MKINLKKLQKAKDIEIVELNPKGNYVMLVDANIMPKNEIAKLDKISGLKWAIAVHGKPEDCLALYEIK